MAILSSDERSVIVASARLLREMRDQNAWHASASGFANELDRIAGPDHNADNANSLNDLAAQLAPPGPSKSAIDLERGATV